MRILFYASYPDLPIGYSKVAHKIATWLAQQDGVELHYFGIGKGKEDGEICRERGIPENIHMINVSSLSTDPFGMDILAETLAALKPDVFLIYNDLIVTCRAFNALLSYRVAHPETRFISYIDLVYPFEKLALIQHLDRNTDKILVFSECWRRNLLDMGIQPKKVIVFPHGVSTDIFYNLPGNIAKAYFGFAEDDFVILNANRNTYRKAQDVTIRAFVEFLIQEYWDPRIKLFLHCDPATKSGYCLSDILETEACRHHVSVDAINSRIYRFAKPVVEDSEMNLIYNAADVGLNTCFGEGFGLCQLEHAALGKPQIVSNVGAFADIFADGGAILVEPRVWIRAATCLDEHSGDLGICDAKDFATAMSTYFRNREKWLKDSTRAAAVLPARYHWPRFLKVCLKSILFSK